MIEENASQPWAQGTVEQADLVQIQDFSWPAGNPVEMWGEGPEALVRLQSHDGEQECQVSSGVLDLFWGLVGNYVLFIQSFQYSGLKSEETENLRGLTLLLLQSNSPFILPEFEHNFLTSFHLKIIIEKKKKKKKLYFMFIQNSLWLVIFKKKKKSVKEHLQ